MSCVIFRNTLVLQQMFNPRSTPKPDTHTFPALYIVRDSEPLSELLFVISLLRFAEKCGDAVNVSVAINITLFYVM